MRFESLKDILSQFPDHDGLWLSQNLDETELLIQSKINIVENEKIEFKNLEMMTQLARLYSLKEKFADSEKILKVIKVQLDQYSKNDRKKIEIRYLLEQGRLFAIQMNPSKAIPIINEAFELARLNQFSFFAIDAALLLSLISPLKKQIEILQWALNECESSQTEETKLWTPYLYVMKAWSLFDSKQFDLALNYFKKALAEPFLVNQKKYLQMIRWSIARTYRAMGDYEQSLKLQYELNTEIELANETNGFVYLEIAECLILQQKELDSKLYFEKAYQILSLNPWYADNKETDLERMKKIYKKRY